MDAPEKSGALLRNMLVVIGGQLAGVPLSILLSAATARFLGPTDFGYLYLAGTLTGFGFLLVEWGHGSVIAAAVARDHQRAGALLGTSVVWRIGAAVLVCAALLVLSKVLGYERAFASVLLLVAVQAFVNSLRSACTDVARGYERLEIGAYAQLAAQLLAVILVIPTLYLGGGLLGVLVMQLVSALIVGAGVWRSLGRIERVPARVERSSLRELFLSGTSFLLFGFVMALQPNIDAVFLSRLTSPAVLGWQAAAQRLMGVLMMPTTALVSALFPTLSRLHTQDPHAFRVTTARALQGTSLLAIPATLACALYREVGAQMFGKGSFLPVEQNLVVLSVLVFLLYFSMPIGTAILASGKQRPFAIVQCLCLVVSVTLDPLLIPWFQKHYQNGGLGVCVAGVVSEIAVLLAALPLIPKGIITGPLAKSIAKGFVAGGAMGGVAFALKHVTPYVAAPISFAAYVACLWLIGGIEREQIEAVRGVILRKLGRRAQA